MAQQVALLVVNVICLGLAIAGQVFLTVIPAENLFENAQNFQTPYLLNPNFTLMWPGFYHY